MCQVLHIEFCTMSIGSKIRQFGEKNYASVKEFADALDMAPSNLQSYMRDDFGVGTKILTKLRNLGCDLNWLFDDDIECKETEKTKEIYELRKELSIIKEEALEYKKKLEKINKAIGKD